MNKMVVPAVALAFVAVATGLALTASSPSPRARADTAPPSKVEPEPAAVETDTVRIEPATQTVAVIGRLIARQAGVIAARIRGAVGEIAADVGDRVARGATIAVLVRETLRAERDVKAAQMAEFEARIHTAEAELGLSRQELARLERLRGSSAFPAAALADKRQDVVRLQSTVVEAKAKAAQAKADLSIADINLENAIIRAPYPGVVTERHTEVGAYLDVGDKVVTMVNDADVEVEAEVPAIRLAGLAVDQQVAVALDERTTVPARVRAIVPRENPLSRTRIVRFALTGPELPPRLAVNQSVTLHLPAGPLRDVLTVHKDAVMRRGGRTIVMVVTDGRAVEREVALSTPVGGRFAVLSGLAAGDRVIVRGNERLREGQAVAPRSGS